MNRERFASKMLILARECAELHNINPIIVASQACLETGYGKSILSKKANNLFGIKAVVGDSWRGLKYPMKTREFCPIRGWIVQQVLYRSYSTWLDCIKDYSQCIENNSGYHEATENAHNPISFIDGIQPNINEKYDWVSDPRYREKILSIAKKWNWL